MKTNKITTKSSIRDWQAFSKAVYGLPNDRDYGAVEMLTQIQRFTMRGLKGIRKKDQAKIKENILIAMSFFMSLMNQLHIDVEEEIWQRFPYVCSYCGSKPCNCKVKKIQSRQKIKFNQKLRPKTLEGFQIMISEIYPAQTRTLEDAGIHLAEEMGEVSEAVINFRGSHKDEDFSKIGSEAADLFSCFMGVFNSLGVKTHKELSGMFNNNCHVCHDAPCTCSFAGVMKYKS